jgi:hyperosmotically inducible periplasmic protein
MQISFKLTQLINGAATLALVTGLLATPAGAVEKELTGLERRVRHELVMLPYYGVFDNLGFRVDGYKVTLTGQVHRPSLRNDAERAVSRLEGVESVDNQIEVLPTSPNDDRLRVALYQAIYYHPNFTKYAFRAVPPIHIIVKNGNVTLLGPVIDEGDKNIAGIQANQVPGVFSVKNELTVEKEQ